MSNEDIKADSEPGIKIGTVANEMTTAFWRSMGTNRSPRMLPRRRPRRHRSLVMAAVPSIALMLVCPAVNVWLPWISLDLLVR